jgi:hypothetical protein
MQPKLGKRMCMNPSSDIVRQQPHRLEGMFFGGIGAQPKSEFPQIADVFRMISALSRGAK